MVYPILKINQDNYEIGFVDTYGRSDLTIEAEDTPSLFYSLLSMFVDHYNEVYFNGYAEGVSDCLDDLEQYGKGDWYY